MLHDKIQELNIELEDSTTDREKEVIVNRIDILKCVLDQLFNLKYDEKVCAINIVDANQQAKRRRKRLNKIQEVQSKINVQLQN